MCFLSYLHKLHLKYNSMTRKSRSCGLPCHNATPYTRLLRMLVLRNTFIFSKHRFVLFTLISLFRMAFLGEMWMIFCRIFVPVWWKSYRNTICGLRIAIYTDIPVYCCSTMLMWQMELNACYQLTFAFVIHFCCCFFCKI